MPRVKPELRTVVCEGCGVPFETHGNIENDAPAHTSDVQLDAAV